MGAPQVSAPACSRPLAQPRGCPRSPTILWDSSQEAGAARARGSTFVQGRAGRDFGVPGRRALPSRWASQLGGDGERSSFFSCKEKGREKESASQRGQEKTPGGPQPLGSRVSTSITEHPTQEWGTKYQARRVRVSISRLLVAVCSPVPTAFSPGTPRQVRAVRTGGNLLPRGNPTRVRHTRAAVASQLLSPSLLP